MPVTRHERVGLSPVLMATNVLIWISAVIVMGILSYLLSLNNNRGDHIIYEEVVAVLTVVFFLAAFVLGRYPGYTLMWNLIFSYLWIVVVAFTFSEFTYSHNALLNTVQAFSFIAFILLFVNVAYDWHLGYRGATTHRTAAV